MPRLGTPALFELRDVVKRFDALHAVGPLSVAITEGCTTALIGPSGSGKSTVLRLLAGLLSPDEGAVLFRGEPLDVSEGAALRRRMGFVVQGGGLFPHLTAEGNVALVARYLRWDESRIQRRLTELLTLMQLPASVLGRLPVELSGGQRQRVSLMRALMLEPDVLLMDEPLGALDPITRFDLQADLRHVFETLGKTVVIVTHDVGEAAFLARDVVLLRDGLLLQEGPIHALVDAPADPFVTRFVNAGRSR